MRDAGYRPWDLLGCEKWGCIRVLPPSKQVLHLHLPAEPVVPACLQYLEMIDDVMRNGVFRGDRTGTGTYSKFGTTMRFNLRHYFPLLTSKRVFWRGGVLLRSLAVVPTSKPVSLEGGPHVSLLPY